MSNNEYSITVKYLHLLAFIIARQHFMIDKAINLPGKNWSQVFCKHHPELKLKKVKMIDWNCHNNNIYNKITHWFEVIGKELQDLVIVPENVYNMDETGVMLCILSSVK